MGWMTPADSGRRSFLTAAICGLWALMTVALAAPAAIYLFSPRKRSRSGEWTEASELASLKLNEPEEVVFRRNRFDGWRVIHEKTSAWLIRTSENQVIALAPQCTHLGCAYHWDEQRRNFLCPCHTSAFSREGEVLSGPAPRPLDRYDVRVQAGKILLGGISSSGNA
jgi:menaquinol-cytochrome c reductase iron-sulfur subunit